MGERIDLVAEGMPGLLAFGDCLTDRERAAVIEFLRRGGDEKAVTPVVVCAMFKLMDAITAEVAKLFSN